jgi:hypothetical protein
MRKTEQAEQQFQISFSRINQLLAKEIAEPEKSLALFDANLALGLGHCAAAIRDVFDKLVELDKKMDRLVHGAARPISGSSGGASRNPSIAPG